MDAETEPYFRTHDKNRKGTGLGLQPLWHRQAKVAGFIWSQRTNQGQIRIISTLDEPLECGAWEIMGANLAERNVLLAEIRKFFRIWWEVFAGSYTVAEARMHRGLEVAEQHHGRSPTGNRLVMKDGRLGFG